jgi:Rps23 Pro-64 3,4-dihydroxylase Tpa1-like proline 4-hydroxylase
MNIKYDKKLNLPYVIVDDFYSEEELVQIWKEIDFLSSEDKLLGPEYTNSSTYLDGDLKKKNIGVFLDDLYLNRDTSNILKLNRKVFDSDFFEELEKLNFSFSFIKNSRKDNTLLSYYGDGDYYNPHSDAFLFTGVFLLYREPKQFEGGELIFTEHDAKIECISNRFILFPSSIRHEVSEVKMKSDVPWMGRYSITSLIGM